MSYYVTSQAEKPNFQALETDTGSLWSCCTSLSCALLDLSSEASSGHSTCQSIEERLKFLQSTIPLRTFTYYGPFESIDELTSYFTNNHPELFI